MTKPGSLDSLPPQLLEWFSVEIDEGDKPELHLIGLADGDLPRCFDVLQRHVACWSDRTFYVDAEQRDFSVQQRPDVADLVTNGAASFACIGAQGMMVSGIELPLVEMFLFKNQIQFFWSPSPAWTAEGVAAMFQLLNELLDISAESRLVPDPRYPEQSRRSLGAAIAAFLGEPTRVAVD